MIRITLMILSLLAPIALAQDTFSPVVPGRTFSFPADHNLQQQFQSQWWYVTANLKGSDGKDYGAQYTLFSNSLLVAGKPQRIFFAHAALSTPDKFYHGERFARDDMRHGGQQANPWQAYVDHWLFEGTGEAPLPGKISVREAQFGYRLNLSSSPYFLQGDQGFSKKNRAGDIASYYYNAPFIKVDGVITIDGQSIKVSGEAWYDREFSSGIFDSRGQGTNLVEGIGWDWLSLHLDDTKALMLYRVRSPNDVYLDGVVMNLDGSKTPLGSDQIQWQPIDYSDFGKHRYPTSWRLKIQSQQIDITITPIHDGQFVDGTIPYFEAAVSTKGSHQATGYLELFGY